MTKKKARANRTRMNKEERTLYPKVLNISAEPGKDGEYTIEIVSTGSVHAAPDPLLGNRYYFGNPELAKEKVVKQGGISSPKIKLSNVNEINNVSSTE